MEKKKSWMLRPVAWICTILMVLCLHFVSKVISRLGEGIIAWLDGLSTVAVVILVVSFGGAFLSLLFYSAFALPSLIVTMSDKIYPSNHAFRYYFIGILEICGCAILILAAIFGFIVGKGMIWHYVRYGWLLSASIAMMVTGREESSLRHNS